MDREVDVKLFITCRLCLEEPGCYQIIPCIIRQIIDCFGIVIDPFDGLPQLICKKCKCILTDYSATKNGFVEKQKQLHNKLPKDNEDVATLVTAAEIHSLPKELAPTADVAPPDEPAQPNDDPSTYDASVNVARHGSRKKKKSSWKKAFDKHFVCTICSKSFLTEKSIKKHAPTHKRFIKTHQKVFKNYLTVRLNKIDELKNRTGGLQNVVYNKDKIIDRGNSQYHYSFYLKKDWTPNDETEENENVAAKRLRVSSDSDDDEQIIKGKKRKTGRLESISSTQTILLEDHKDPAHAANTDNSNETEIVNTEYINLDDTSSDCPKNNAHLEKKRKLPKRRKIKAEVGDYKAIQNIVTMCHKNYIKKVQADTHVLNKSAFSESSLKHKVLSLGRKVLNEQGFVCTGLLRYMEHKDLDIKWTPTTSNFVRVMPKLKSREYSENDDALWKNVHDISLYRDNGLQAVASTAHEVNGEEQASLQPAQTDEDTFSSESNDIKYVNKLLNSTPAANPRQLPKNNNISDGKLVVAADDAAMTPSDLDITDGLEEAQVDDDNMCLPIITSTTSLSVSVNEKEKLDVPIIEKPTPRIKVKPASELMTARALKNLDTAEDVWAFNKLKSSLPHYLPNTASVESNNVSSPSNDKDKQGRHDEYIILDSLQFPNTKTLAPFQYFRKVLFAHGLQLLDLNEDLDKLSYHFSCLIKFRLILKQDSKRPISVLLSLYSSKDSFCFAFKDYNSKNFDPTQLPAFWQWELLKIYKSNIGDKILQNAFNVGKDVYESTKLFLGILKCINLIKEL